MTEAKSAENRHVAWEYEQVDTASLHAQRDGRGVDYETRLKMLGREGWEAYAVISFEGGGLRFFLKRPVTIDPPPDPGRAARAPIDPPPDPG